MSQRGKLKIFLGYAAGVGKTYQMLEEAQNLKARGTDVVIGYFEPRGRKDTIAQTAGLEMVPRAVVEYRGSRYEEIDTEAILARRPSLAIIDELPHTNGPGSPRAKRWEDVMYLLDAGIDVFTTMNVQHLESLNDRMTQITGAAVRETIPDWVLKEADEVVMVDVTPRALLNRLERGVVYPPEQAKRAMQTFFKESTLVALREMALRQTAQEVEDRIAQGAAEPGSEMRGRRLDDAVVIYVSPDPSTAMLIRRGKRVADALQARCLAVFIGDNGLMRSLPEPRREAVERHLNFARNMHIETAVLAGKEPAKILVDFAREHGARQIFLPREAGKGFDRLLGRNLVNEVVTLAHDIEVTIVADRKREQR